jgi:hypothetical protein
VAAREISIRVSAPDAAPVDVHVAARGSQIHVAVRTPDEAMQGSLRQDLHSLVDRLEAGGLRTEVFTPDQTRETSFDISSSFRTHAVAETTPAGAEQEPSGREGDPSQPRPDEPSQRQQQHRRRQAPLAAWEQFLEEQS